MLRPSSDVLMFNLYTTDLSILVVCVCFVFLWRRVRRLSLPDGPPGMPLLGEAGSKSILEQYNLWAKEYGQSKLYGYIRSSSIILSTL